MDVRLLIYVVALGLVAYGSWLVYEPLGYIVPGAMLIGGLYWTSTQGRSQEPK